MNFSFESNAQSPECSHQADDSFGPVVESCVRRFDFTLLFEQTILSILPSTIFLILAFSRLTRLSTKKQLIKVSTARTIKVTVLGLLFVLYAVLVALWSTHRAEQLRTRASIAAAIIDMVVYLTALTLSFFEHTKSAGPSLLLNLYLTISILFDAVRIRTLWLLSSDRAIAALSIVCLVVKVAVLILEECGKRQWLLPSQWPWSTEVTGGIFNRTLFVWLDSMMWKGYSNALAVVTLPDIDSHLLSESLWNRIEPTVHRARSENSSLLLAVFWTLKWPLLAPVLPYLVLVASQLAQPFLISTILNYVASPYDGSEDQRNIGYGLIAAYGFVYLCIAIATAWGQHLSYRFVVMLRGILVTSIYRKTVTLDLSVATEASAVTLMSTDVERIVLGMVKIHDTWSTLIQVACAMFILYQQIGVVFIAPVVLSIACTFASLGLSAFAGAFQVAWMTELEKRIAITSSLLGSIKGVKMLGWSTKASELIQRLRLAEIASARKFRLMLLSVVAVSFVPVTLAPVATFGIFAARSQDEGGSALGSTRIFTILSLLSLITQPLDLLFAYVPEIIAAVACFSRIQAYLYRDAISDARSNVGGASIKYKGPGNTANGSPHDSESLTSNEKLSGVNTAITLAQASFGWSSEEEPVIRSIDLIFPAGKLTMITGPVASGKSTLLKGILGETPISRGTVEYEPRSVAFCDQNPWLANDTLRVNILGSSHFDPSWYASVTKACALDQDIGQFPDGDQVNIGSSGLSLSGGQKQRVAIARAVYSKKEIALFDDVFSGLDMKTQSHIMRNVFAAGGLLAVRNTTVVFVTHASHLLIHADHVVELDSKGQVVKEGEPGTLEDENRSVHEPRETGSAADSHATKLEDPDLVDIEPAPQYPLPAPKSVDSETQRLGDWSVYKYYFSAFGWPKTLVFFALQITLVFCLKFPEIILSWWGESNDREPHANNGKWLGIFTALEVAALISLVLTCWHVLLNLAVISGKKLHYTLLSCTLRAPLSFFSATDTGSITNRFSQDMNLIDAELPFSLINFVCNGLTCIAQAFMIIPASAWLLIGYPILFGILWLLQRFYLRTSRQLRFLDLDSKSPIYSQFLETLGGLATIRAFGWQDDLIRKADERLDYSQKPFYLLYSIQRWLNLVLDLIVACLAVVLITVAVCLRNSTSVGFAGVALFNIMNLSAALKSAITSWTMLETSIGAVARVKRYQESTPDENQAGEDEEPPKAWPAVGAITFKNVTASYKDDYAQTAISNISMSITGGEKVGICGRSGSGKSSMLLSLLHLTNIKGSIVIDALDIACIPRELLRKSLTAVPQDPVFLSGSVRLNCDPSGSASDESIVDALNTVQLWGTVEAKGGLDADLKDDFFSKGQQQLFGLARALLNHSRVILLDEASSSLDAESEQLMMNVVKDRFKECTVLSVAHRLETILDFDKVLVLDNGKIVEEGNPRALLNRPSAFKALYESSGHTSEA